MRLILSLIITILFITPVQAAEKDREKIGEILGRSIYHDQINEKRDLSSELHRLFRMPFQWRYFEPYSNELEPKYAEIEYVAEYSNRKYKEDLKKGKFAYLENKLQEIEKKLEDKNLTKDENEKLTLEKETLLMILKPPGKSQGRYIAMELLSTWKFNRHLYDNFGGGRILGMQGGHVAFDAMLKWLKHHEAKGDFKIIDPELHDEFYSFWAENEHSNFFLDEGLIEKEFLHPEWEPVKQKLTRAADHIRFIRDVKASLEDPLPPISKVVTRYKKPSMPAKSLLVADLINESDDGLPWGKVLGRILRWKIMFSPSIVLRMPDIKTYYQDAWSYGMDDEDIGRSLESIKLVGKRLGIDYALSGKIRIVKDKLNLVLMLQEISSDKTVKIIRYSGNVRKIPQTIPAAVYKVYQALGIELNQNSWEYIAITTPLTFDELKSLVQLKAKIKGASHEEAFKLVNEKWLQGVSLPFVAASYLYYLKPGEDLPAYHEKLYKVYDKFPMDVGIELIVSRYIRNTGRDELLKAKIKRIQKIIRENLHDPTAMIILADFLVQSKHFKESLSVCIESLNRWPDNYRIWWNFSWVLMQYSWHLRGTALWVDIPGRAKRLVPELQYYALIAANEAVALNSDNADLWDQRMVVMGGYRPEFMQSFYAAIRIDPKNRNVYEDALNYTQAKWGGSQEIQREVWVVAKKNVQEAEWLEKMKKRYSIDSPPTDLMERQDTAEYWIETGDSFQRLANYNDAIDAYKKALEIQPDHDEAYANLGLAYVEQGKYDKAIEHYQQAIKLKPDNADTHYNLGVAYGNLKKYKEAIESYMQVIKIDPDYAKAYNNIGDLYNKSWQYKKAIEYLKKAVEIKPDYPLAYVNLGVSYVELGKREEAIEAWKQAVKVKPDYAGAHFNLGRLYAMMKKKDLALKEYEILKKLKSPLAVKLSIMINK
jgi:tetratricopeptide (TPR) repeat protein